MRLITPGISGQTGRDHQAVKVKVVACALSTGHYARGTHRAHQARAEQTAAHVTRLTLMRGEELRTSHRASVIMYHALYSSLHDCTVL